jgi:hypothetical protein
MHTGGFTSAGNDLTHQVQLAVHRNTTPASGMALSKAPNQVESTTSTKGPAPVPSCDAVAYVFRREVDHAPCTLMGARATTVRSGAKNSSRGTLMTTTTPAATRQQQGTRTPRELRPRRQSLGRR